jgi:hypothetical protein
MSENTEMSLNRKIAVGILSILTISFMGAGIYFLSKKTEKADHQENFSNNAKGYAFLSVGIVLLIATIITVINPKFRYDPYLDPYYDPYLNQPFHRHHNHHRNYSSYHRPYPYPYPRRPTPYPYPIVPVPLF